MTLSQAIGFGIANALFCAANLVLAASTGAPLNAIVMFFSGLCLADCVRTIKRHDRASSAGEMGA